MPDHMTARGYAAMDNEAAIFTARTIAKLHRVLHPDEPNAVSHLLDTLSDRLEAAEAIVDRVRSLTEDDFTSWVSYESGDNETEEFHCPFCDDGVGGDHASDCLWVQLQADD